MLYTRKGDDGTTGLASGGGKFGCDQRISKSSAIAEALGVLDEVNSYLGVVKVMASQQKVADLKKLEAMLHQAQENLFIIQAEVAGAEKMVSENSVKEIEATVDSIEKTLPPIKTFFISGGTELAASLDFARTLARRAERRVIAVSEEGLVKVDGNMLAYLNRLSSLLYALTRLSNHIYGKNEVSPKY
ncbi:MAG: cob(I)yrinic acid a,c-diamide adenosyltransferase [Candidatus Taylorbacteria bacterium]